jgi:hypothetical protein
VPQDIPLEASEELVFTPASFEKLGDAAPTFTLRAATTRDKRYHRRLQIEAGLAYHSNETLRAELLAGLSELWSPEAVEQHVPVIKAYWEAADDFALQAKDDPSLTFEYDPEIVAAIADLSKQVVRSWPRYREMIADNVEFDDLMTVLMVAAYVKGWTGIEPAPRLAGGYVTFASAEELRDAVQAFEKKHGIPEGGAWMELFIACSRRLNLDQEEAKNSESPSPSETTPPASSETKASEPAGKSPASARSKKTPATA